MDQFQHPFQESREVKLRQLLIRERWPEMLKGCRACIHWDDFKRPECCGDCGIGDRRRQAVTEESPPSKSPGIWGFPSFPEGDPSSCSNFGSFY
ncbi:hypothetical protein [Thermostichus sp. MS-CIW-41]|jgi:hypothetical protein